MMVVFKSAPILKRALKVREENLQLYALKVFEKNILSKDSFILRFESKFIVTFTLYTNLRKSLIREFGSDRNFVISIICLLYTSPSPRDATLSRMPSSA